MSTSTDRIRFLCSSCGYRARIPAKYTGQVIACPGCKKAQEAVPADDAPATGLTQEVKKPSAAAADDKFRFVCDDCNYRARIPVKYAGMAIKCPGCGKPKMADQQTEGAQPSTGGTVEIRKVDLSGGGDRFLFQCPGCGYRARLPTSYEGQQIKCPGCNSEQHAVAPANPGPSTGQTAVLNKVEAPTAKPVQAAPPLSAPAAPGMLDLDSPASSSGSLDLGGPITPDNGLDLDASAPASDSLDLGAPAAIDSSLDLGAPAAVDSSLDLGAPAAPESDSLDFNEEPAAPRAPEPRGLDDDEQEDSDPTSSDDNLLQDLKRDSQRAKAKRKSERMKKVETESVAARKPSRPQRTESASAPAKDSKLHIVGFALAGLFLIGAVALGYMWNETKGKLADTETALATEKREHDSTKQALDTEKGEHASTRKTLAGEKEAHADTQNKLEAETAKITDLRAQVSLAEENAAKSQAEADRLRKEADDLADKQLDAERKADDLVEQLEKIKAVAESSEWRIQPELLEAIGLEL